MTRWMRWFLLGGDRLAWEQSVKQLEQALLAYPCARGDHDDAQDALQNAWAKAWEKGLGESWDEELPPEQRDLMLKRMIMQAIEVAEDLNVPVGTVHSGFNRARAKVRICMERKYKGGSL